MISVKMQYDPDSKPKMEFLLFLALLGPALGFPNRNTIIQFDDRISGGEVALIEEHPYQVSLEYFRQHFCGGALLSETLVLTAAHCTAGSQPGGFAVRLGSSLNNEEGSLINVLMIKLHPSYSSFNRDYDIALLELAKPAIFSERVQPVTFAVMHPLFYTNAYVTGWGGPENSDPSTNKLYRFHVTTLPKVECQQYYPNEDITDRMLCAIHEAGGQRFCQGSPGSPLVADGLLIGIASWSYGCDEPKRPAVYTSVADVSDWILQTEPTFGWNFLKR